MYCPKCGKENPDNAQLCNSCSSALTSTPTQAPTPVAKTSGLAIISLVLAILSPFIFLMTALPAIIIGIVSLVEIKKSTGQLKGRGLAIAGIAVSAASLFMILTIGILRPELLRIQQISPRLTCSHNMHSINTAILIYKNEHEDEIPTSSNWCDLLVEHSYAKPSMFRCKGTRKGPCNYAMNKNIDKLDVERASPDMVLLFETHPGWNQFGGPEILTTDNHKGEGCNVLFMDSHVEFIRTKYLNDLKWEPE